ncbi:hypothetical protein [Romboutsia sp. Marseille-P6047]|uniref:hypothetical protein n=1 Tax=Romboutsia sp. Marseille-P6047 TaxID=2161817 RepID=UPI000F06ECEA|nr:hypothetical protein [Romboutsia sp. Marseille-P6047]
MSSFESLTPLNGLDFNNLINARQNNYAWSISGLGDYIYVGTGRNIIPLYSSLYIQNLRFPLSLTPTVQDDRAEIWRLRKDGNSTWEKVLKAPYNSNIYGFRYMVNYRAYNGNPALYAAGTCLPPNKLKIYKSVNGIDWMETKSTVYNRGTLEGNSSRAMVIFDNKLYVANIDEGGQVTYPLLYSNIDPEFFSWELETYPSSTPNFDPNKNPSGAIVNMAVFNNRLYLATSINNKIRVWRTDTNKTELNKWTLVVDGFGNPSNTVTLAMGVFKNHLYLSGTKELPLSWIIPQGFDLIRLDKDDKVEMIVGPNSISGINSGFNNPFNVYGWQIQEYNGALYISTFDSALFMQLILEILSSYRSDDALSSELVDTLIKMYRIIVRLLNEFNYPFGFNLYKSLDGVHFLPVFLNGLGNRYNYGGRILYVDSLNDLYLGTANPFQGLEVWKYNLKYPSNDMFNTQSLPNYNKLIDSIQEFFPELNESTMNLFKTLIDSLSIN